MNKIKKRILLIIIIIIIVISIMSIIGISFIIPKKVNNINLINTNSINNHSAINLVNTNSINNHSAINLLNTDSINNHSVINFAKNDSAITSIKNHSVHSNTNTSQSKKLWYKPKPKISWQWQLQGKINTNYDVNLYDIDLFDSPQSIIDELHNRGIKVICYTSVGSSENWRDDFEKFPKSVLGKNYGGWPGEKWLDISNYKKFKDIIIARLNLAVKKKCDGIEPDNIQNYQENTGFSITYQEQLKYNIWLANEAHKRNLAIALKNDGEQVKDLIDYYDFAIVESCFEWNECKPFEIFTKQNKAVLGVEYNLKPKEFCDKANNLNFSWLKMNYDLDGNRISCQDI